MIHDFNLHAKTDRKQLLSATRRQNKYIKW